MKCYTILFTIVLIAQMVSTYGQSTKGMYFNNGLSYASSKETRFTSGYLEGTGFSSEIGYASQSDNKRKNISISYIQTNHRNSNLVSTLNYWLTIKYEQLRKIKGSKSLYVGGYVDLSTLFSERIGAWRPNNNISYTQWSSIGLGLNHTWLIRQTLKLETEFNFPIVAYLTRPAYASVSTSNFLKPGRYNLRGDEQVSSGLKGGRLSTINRFRNLELKTAIYFPFKKGTRRWYWGLQYAIRYMSTNEQKPISHVNQLISISLKRK